MHTITALTPDQLAPISVLEFAELAAEAGGECVS